MSFKTAGEITRRFESEEYGISNLVLQSCFTCNHQLLLLWLGEIVASKARYRIIERLSSTVDLAHLALNKTTAILHFNSNSIDVYC